MIQSRNTPSENGRENLSGFDGFSACGPGTKGVFLEIGQIYEMPGKN